MDLNKLDAYVKKLGDWGDKLIYFFGCTGLLLAVALCSANILTWWTMGRRLAVADEISLIGLVWASYVGMGLLYRTNGHCVMDFVVKLFSPKAQVVIRIITDVLIHLGHRRLLLVEAVHKVLHEEARADEDTVFLLRHLRHHRLRAPFPARHRRYRPQRDTSC